MDEELRVVIGSGGSTHNRGWMHTEETELNLLQEEHWAARFKKGSITAILAEHVWEHLTYEQGVQAAAICYSYLAPGPLDHPAASHRIVHNYNTLRSMFEAGGFEVNLLEYCDETGQFHFNPWNEEEGLIYRSKRFDHRNAAGRLGFVSLIVDAVKKS